MVMYNHYHEFTASVVQQTGLFVILNKSAQIRVSAAVKNMNYGLR